MGGGGDAVFCHGCDHGGLVRVGRRVNAVEAERCRVSKGGLTHDELGNKFAHAGSVGYAGLAVASEGPQAIDARHRSDVESAVDGIDGDGATCRTWADAPEIDGNLFIDEGFETLNVGDVVSVKVDEAGEYDLWARRL